MTKAAQYEKCVLTFFDILGFKESVGKRSPKEVYKILNVFSRANKVEEYPTAPEVLVVSDSAIRISRVHSEANKRYPSGILFHELNNLTFIQAELAQSGVFVRGAVVIGEVFFRDGILFGPAYLRALELESKHAVVPRVIVDPAAIRELEKDPLLCADHHDIRTEKGYVLSLLCRSKDGLQFVDYLRAMSSNCDDAASYLVYLGDHKEQVEQAAKTAPLSAVEKCAWLAGYHNSVISCILEDEIVSLGGSKERLIIDQTQYQVCAGI